MVILCDYFIERFWAYDSYVIECTQIIEGFVNVYSQRINYLEFPTCDRIHISINANINHYNVQMIIVTPLQNRCSYNAYTLGRTYYMTTCVSFGTQLSHISIACACTSL